MKTALISLFYAILVSLSIFFLISIYFLIRMGSINLEFFKSKESIAGIAYGISLYLTGTFLGYILKKTFPKENDWLKRLLVYIPLVLITTPIIIFLINYIIETSYSGISIQRYYQQENWEGYPTLTIIALAIGVLFHLFYIYQVYKNQQITKQKKIAGEATAQLESLKNQIDPHFLFNSLNVLIGLIEEDADNAIAYTKSLSRIYRYILEQKDKDLATVQEELKFAKHYIALLKLRFEDALQFEVESLEPYSHRAIPPLSLQLLLENCIQHNTLSEERPLKIKIYAEVDYLVVENILQEKKTPIQSTRIGLSNIKERYALFTKRQVHIQKTADHFIVKLPILAHENH